MVTLLGAGKSSPEDVAAALTLAPILVAADGGAARALDLGHSPVAVIGDMDSLNAATRARLDPATVHPVTEQDSTDFDKALRSIDAPAVLAVGFTGNRIDHELAAWHTLLRRPARRCVVIGTEDIAFLCPPEIALDLPVGMRVSLFPFAPLRARSSGLRWPIDAVAFDPLTRIGTSNRSVAPRVELSPDRPALLVILPKPALPAVLDALV